eukprot:13648756-Alexandrium_andersonii.AAC.1
MRQRRVLVVVALLPGMRRPPPPRRMQGPPGGSLSDQAGRPARGRWDASCLENLPAALGRRWR